MNKIITAILFLFSVNVVFGQTYWKQYGTFYNVANLGCRTSDGGIVRIGAAPKIVSPTSGNRGNIFKVDSNGNLLWQKLIDNGVDTSYCYGTSVMESKSHSLYFCGEWRSKNNPDST